MIQINDKARYVASTHDDKTYVLCDFLLDPRSYLSEEDQKELKNNCNVQISAKTKQKLLALCETPAANYSPVWNFEACWRSECPVTNEKYLDPLFEEIKKRYPNKQLMINSNVTTYAIGDWFADKKYCEEYGIKNAQVFNQNENDSVKEITEGKTYIIIGDQAFRDKVQAKMKGNSQLFYYPV